ncbi:ferritin-like domain-containing protein [Clostridioides sp. ES-S-0048-02]|uniref:ferritin-like domain-containing protein n=1 Tax=Clostridioides sp. ES-S-0048-02 TaxID=2770777 RepID=UPI001D1144AD|nr:manganese catalase family protein [Clostridioides sp. ES-S-0048-02]
MSDAHYNMHKRKGYSSDEPYPEIKVLGPNKYYAELLMDDYSGVASEFTSVTQYLYHDFDLDENYRELSEMWINISITEMLHMEILAKTIRLLGGNPIYRGSTSSCGAYWNGGFVFYGDSICSRLKSDLNLEYVAIENYYKDISIIEDPYIKAILNRIILDEKVHVGLFKKAIEKYCR